MGFFEVQTESRSIDFGASLPLRHTERPFARGWVHLLLGTVLFFVVPLAYLLDQIRSWRELGHAWPALVVMGLWTFLCTVAVSRALAQVVVEVNEHEVSSRGTGTLVEHSWTEPLEHYSRLEVVVVHHPEWIGNKEEHGVRLVHPRDAERSLTLYWGRSRERASERAATYAALLGKPLDPNSGTYD